MPELSKEFVKNILNTSFIEWERINKVNIETMLRVKDPDELRNQMDQLWEIFRRNIDKFIVIPEQKLKLEKIRDDFFRAFEDF